MFSKVVLVGSPQSCVAFVAIAVNLEAGYDWKYRSAKDEAATANVSS